VSKLTDSKLLTSSAAFSDQLIAFQLPMPSLYEQAQSKSGQTGQ